MNIEEARKRHLDQREYGRKLNRMAEKWQRYFDTNPATTAMFTARAEGSWFWISLKGEMFANNKLLQTTMVMALEHCKYPDDMGELDEFFARTRERMMIELTREQLRNRS